VGLFWPVPHAIHDAGQITESNDEGGTEVCTSPSMDRMLGPNG